MVEEEVLKFEDRQEETNIAVRAVFSEDPVKALTVAERVVKAVSQRCKGKRFISNIKGHDYPRVEWWTTVGASLGLFPYTVWSRRVERDNGNYLYEARVEVRKNGNAITAAEALCSTAENNWKDDDEYAIRSMAITRATAKAYRLGLSFIATLAGLEATPAEEVPQDGFKGKSDRATEGKKSEKAQKGKTETTKAQKENKARMAAWLLAEANGEKDKVPAFIRTLTKKMYDSLDALTTAHFTVLWNKVKKDVLEYEKSTPQPNGKEEVQDGSEDKSSPTV